MNFDFSEDLNLLREEARKFMAEQCPTAAVRRVLERNGGEAGIDRALWRKVSDMGWLGAAVPEQYGGVGLGHEALCVIAEELGRAIAPIPFASTAYLVVEALLAYGSEAQKAEYLPRLVSGELIGAFALAEGPGEPRAASISACLKGGQLTADKWPVADLDVADLLVVAALDEVGEPTLVLLSVDAKGVERQPLKTLDPSRDHGRLRCSNAHAEQLGEAACGWQAIQALLDKAAVLYAFEQIGGAQACLDMAKAYSKERIAFGRPIGSFQAIKHKLADMYISIELARSNAYYGAWALQAGASELGLAAAAARVAATDAYHLAAKENIQTHGGMGFTWEMDCHLFYRRAKVLALAVGSTRHWKDRLVTQWAEQADVATTAAA